MTGPGRGRRRLVHGLILAAFLVAAGLVEHGAARIVPLAGMPVHGAVGTPVHGRNLTVVVNDATTADELRSGGKVIPTTGRWLVVDATVTATQDNSLPLAGARLVVDDDEYSPTQRAGDTLAGTNLETAIPISGQLIFELPSDALSGAHSIQVELSYESDDRLDSVLQIPLPSTDLSHRDTTEVEALQWGQR